MPPFSVRRSGRLFLLTALLTPLWWMCCSGAALAADSEQPVKLEARRVSVDDVTKVHVFEGDVSLTQGSLNIKADKLLLTRDADGFKRGVASGGANGLARFSQQRENGRGLIKGEAERIEYNAREEKAEFFGRARLNNNGDEVAGHHIVWDSPAGKFLVTASPQDKNGGRVTAVIQPRKQDQP